MKKILITGANSYIGESVERWLKQFEGRYTVDTLDMLDANWQEYNFSEYDTVFHVAGIAHIKETKENAHVYYDVNERLAIDVANKAKNEGVHQFVILSTMSVYGIVTGHITKKTIPNPVTNYGKSKLNADNVIEKMECDTFKVAILRPPMVYGKGCKGNYQMLRKFALLSPIFPDFKNERSMIYVENLAAFVERVIHEDASGIFFPQDAEYVSTESLVKCIADINEKKIVITSVFNWAVKLALFFKIGVFKKVFGSLTYEKVDLVSEYNFEQAIGYTEGQ